MAAFVEIRDALRPLVPAATLTLAYSGWVIAVIVAMMLLRDDRAIAAVALLGAVVLAFVPMWRRRWRYFALVALALGAFLGVAEALIRLNSFGMDALWHHERYSPFGAMSDPDYLEPASEPGVVYTLRPGFDGWVKGVRISANSLGVRGREWAIQKSRGRVRILALGTSITLGEGVPADGTFTTVLGDRLGRKGFDVEAMNFGIGGYDLGAAQALLRARGLQFHPDIVVQEFSVSGLSETFASVGNLARSFANTRTNPPRASFFERNSFALFAIYPPVSLRARLAGFFSTPVSAAAADGFVEQTLMAFGALAGDEQFTGVVFVPRPIHTLQNPDLDAPGRQEIRRIATSAGLVYVDSYGRFSVADSVEALSIYPAEMHPNGVAHARHASALLDALEPIVATIAAARKR